jgi:DNA-binding MarR family transcriptional regulator
MTDAVEALLAQWRRERPDLDTSPMGVVGRISRLARLVETAQRRTFAEHGLDPASFDVLATLRRSGPPYRLTPGELTRSAMVTSGAITQRLDGLEARGLVRRTPSTEDGRSRVVELTPGGRAAVDAVLPHHLATERQLLAGLAGDDLRALATLLGRLLEELEGPAAPGQGSR